MDNFYLYRLFARVRKCVFTVDCYGVHFHSKDYQYYWDTPAKYEFYIPLVERYLRRFYPNTGMFNHNRIIMNLCTKIHKKHRYLYAPTLKALERYFFDSFMVNGKCYDCYWDIFKVLEECKDQTILDLLYEIRDCNVDYLAQPNKNEAELDAKVTQYLIPKEEFHSYG
jgi:hypothetical protein